MNKVNSECLEKLAEFDPGSTLMGGMAGAGAMGYFAHKNGAFKNFARKKAAKGIGSMLKKGLGVAATLGAGAIAGKFGGKAMGGIKSFAQKF